jgi:predicted acylesterase/phospholipase RssA
MREKSGALLTVAIGAAAGAVIGMIISKTMHAGENEKAGNTAMRRRKRERLIFVRRKLENKRNRLDRYITRIGGKIETLKDSHVELARPA